MGRRENPCYWTLQLPAIEQIERELQETIGDALEEYIGDGHLAIGCHESEPETHGRLYFYVDTHQGRTDCIVKTVDLVEAVREVVDPPYTDDLRFLGPLRAELAEALDLLDEALGPGDADDGGEEQAPREPERDGDG